MREHLLEDLYFVLPSGVPGTLKMLLWDVVVQHLTKALWLVSIFDLPFSVYMKCNVFVVVSFVWYSLFFHRQRDCGVHPYANGHGWPAQVHIEPDGTLPVCHCVLTCLCTPFTTSDLKGMVVVVYMLPHHSGQCRSCCSTPSLMWTTLLDEWRGVCCTSLPSKIQFPLFLFQTSNVKGVTLNP